ncbi:MAG TPA: TolC family protein, partial [Bacteroidales bacterium]|nr:TolC family protein [Bacteroidales bacterium]
GLNLQIPIFNGGTYRIRQKTAQLNTNNARLQKENLFNELTSSARKTHQAYKNALTQIDIQQTSSQLSEKLVALVLQKFQLNQSTILDLKAAQQSYENSAYLLVNLQYQAKVAEIELKRLSCLLK